MQGYAKMHIWRNVMPLLQVRDCPEDVYEKLVRVARNENRSVPQEIIVLLRHALEIQDSDRQRRLQVLKKLENLDLSSIKALPNSVKIIRENRDQ